MRLRIAVLVLTCVISLSDKSYAQNSEATAALDVCSKDGKSEPNAFFDVFKKLGRGQTVYFGGRDIPTSADGYWQKEYDSSVGSRNIQRTEKCGPYVRTIEVVEYSKGSTNKRDETRVKSTIVSCAHKIRYTSSKSLEGVGLSNSQLSDLSLFNPSRATVDKAEMHSDWWNHEYVDVCANITYPDNPELLGLGTSLDTYANSEQYKKKIADEREGARQDYRRKELADIGKYSVLVACEKGYYAGMTRTIGERLVDVRKGIAPPQVFSETMRGMKDHCAIVDWPVTNPQLLWNKQVIGTDGNLVYFITADETSADNPNLIMIKRY